MRKVFSRFQTETLIRGVRLSHPAMQPQTCRHPVHPDCVARVYSLAPGTFTTSSVHHHHTIIKLLPHHHHTFTTPLPPLRQHLWVQLRWNRARRAWLGEYTRHALQVVTSLRRASSSRAAPAYACSYLSPYISHVLVHGLEPRTRYYYTVSNGLGPTPTSREHSFLTLPPPRSQTA